MAASSNMILGVKLCGADKNVGAYEAMTDYGATPADLGKFGEALCELEDIDMNSPVYLLFNVARNKG